MGFDKEWKKVDRLRKRQKSAINDKKEGVPPSPRPGLVGRGGSHKILEDLVNTPSHYRQHDLEAIDGIKGSMSKEEFKGYLKGAALKYLWRYQYKKEPVEDLRKAKWYLDKLLKEVLDEKPTINDPKS